MFTKNFILKSIKVYSKNLEEKEYETLNQNIENSIDMIGLDIQYEKFPENMFEKESIENNNREIINIENNINNIDDNIPRIENVKNFFDIFLSEDDPFIRAAKLHDNNMNSKINELDRKNPDKRKESNLHIEKKFLENNYFKLRKGLEKKSRKHKYSYNLILNPTKIMKRRRRNNLPKENSPEVRSKQNISPSKIFESNIDSKLIKNIPEEEKMEISDNSNKNKYLLIKNRSHSSNSSNKVNIRWNCDIDIRKNCNDKIKKRLNFSNIKNKNNILNNININKNIYNTENKNIFKEDDNHNSNFIDDYENNYYIKSNSEILKEENNLRNNLEKLNIPIDKAFFVK